MAGRKRKPVGTAQPPAGELVPPGHLDADELEAFQLLESRLKEAKLASTAHSEVVAIAAQRMVEIERLSADIREQGSTYWTTSTKGDQVLKSNPAVAMRNESMRHYHSLLAELGLTPTSAAKASAPRNESEDTNKFARFKAARQGA